MKKLLWQIAVFISGVLAALVWSAAISLGQTLPIQDCCHQAIELNTQLNTMTAKYNESIKVLEKTRAAGDRLIDQKEDRISAVKDQANTKLGTANRQTGIERAGRIKSDSLLTIAKADLRAEFLHKRPLWFWFKRKKWINDLLIKLE